jgi:translation initiation factor IF-1
MPERIRIGVLTLDPQGPQNLVAGHVRQVEVQQDDVVIVELAEVDTLFAQIGGVHVEAF